MSWKTEQDDAQLASICTWNPSQGRCKARKIVLNWSQYELVDGVLYRVAANKSLIIFPPALTGRIFLMRHKEELLVDI